MSARLARRVVAAIWFDVRRVFLGWAIGPQCTTCGERRRGPRTLARHLELDHAGDPS